MAKKTNFFTKTGSWTLVFTDYHIFTNLTHFFHHKRIKSSFDEFCVNFLLSTVQHTVANRFSRLFLGLGESFFYSFYIPQKHISQPKLKPNLLPQTGRQILSPTQNTFRTLNSPTNTIQQTQPFAHHHHRQHRSQIHPG